MVIGNGLIATAFRDRKHNCEDRIIFASGVANSQETRVSEFLREEALLSDAIVTGKQIVYFSTCSIEDPEQSKSAYVMHKKHMEGIIMNTNNYLIFRLPQIVGYTQNKTIITNYLYEKILNGEPFLVWRNATRNLLDVEDMISIANYIIFELNSTNMRINIASPFTSSILEMVTIFETIMNKKANYEIVEKGGPYIVDCQTALEIAALCNVNFDIEYPARVIGKYFGR